MKMFDLIYDVNTSEENKILFTPDELLDSCGLMERSFKFEIYQDHPDLSAFALIQWLCTDTVVGLAVIFFKNKPVAFYERYARKEDPKITYLNSTAYNKTRKFLLSFEQKENEQEETPIKFLDLEQEVIDHYKISFSSQLLNTHTSAIYKGEKVKILATRSRTLGDEECWVKAGEKKIKVKMYELEFPFNLR